MIMQHPTRPEFHPGHHPSYIDFYEQVLTADDRPGADAQGVRGVLRHRPVVHAPLPDRPRLPRRPPLLHVVLVRARAGAPRAGSSSSAGTPRRCAGSGSPRPARSNDALEIASDVVGPSPTLTHMHNPPHLHGGRPLMARSGTAAPGADRPASPSPRPSWPATVERPDPERKVGLDYDHEWSRRYPVRLARAVVMDNVTRPAARPAGPGHRARARAPPARRGAGDLRGQPRQPHRHPAAADHAARGVPPPDRSSPPPRTTSSTAPGSRCCGPSPWPPSRSSAARSTARSADTAAELRRGRVEPGHLPRGRALARRLDPALPRRRRLPGPAHRPAGRPGLPPRDPPRPAQDARKRGRGHPGVGHRVPPGRPAPPLAHRRALRCPA